MSLIVGQSFLFKFPPKEFTTLIIAFTRLHIKITIIKTTATTTDNIGPKMNFNKNANICATINNKMIIGLKTNII